MSFDEEPDGDSHGECAAEIKRLTDALAQRDTPCEWREDDSGELWDSDNPEAGSLYGSCRWLGYWEGPAPSFCPGCGHPVKSGETDNA